MSLKAFKSSQARHSCRWLAAVAAITMGSGLACAPNESRQQLPPQATGGHAPFAQEHAGGTTSNDPLLPAVQTQTRVGDVTDKPNGGNKTATSEFQLDAKLLSNDTSPIVEVVFTNSSQSEVGIYLGESIDAIYIDVFREDSARVPQEIVPGKSHPRDSHSEDGSSGSTSFVKPNESLKWTVNLGEFFDLPNAKYKVIAKINVVSSDANRKVINTLIESRPVEFVVK